MRTRSDLPPGQSIPEQFPQRGAPSDCPGCLEREARIEQLQSECRRLDEKVSYKEAARRDARRREETERYLGPIKPMAARLPTIDSVRHIP